MGGLQGKCGLTNNRRCFNQRQLGLLGQARFEIFAMMKRGAGPRAIYDRLRQFFEDPDVQANYDLIVIGGHRTGGVTLT